MHEEIITRAGEIIARKTGGGNEGYFKWITFCTGLGGTKTTRIEKCNRASVCFDAVDYNITLVGTIEIQTDPVTKKEMWYEGLENHFSGFDDPNYCALLFKTERYNLLVDWKEARGNL